MDLTMALIEPFPELPFEIISFIIEEILQIEPKRAVELISLSPDIQPMQVKSLLPLLSPLKLTKYLRIERALYSTVILNHPATSLFVDMINHVYILSKSHQGPRWAQSLLNSFPLPMLFYNDTYFELDIKPELFDGKCLHCMQHLTHLSLVDGAGSTPTAIWFLTLIQRLHLADSIAVCIIYSHFPFKDGTGDYLSSPEPRIVLATTADESLDNKPLEHRLDGQEKDMWEEAEKIVEMQRAKANGITDEGVANSPNLFPIMSVSLGLLDTSFTATWGLSTLQPDEGRQDDRGQNRTREMPIRMTKEKR
ncbi:hypothetical protein C8J56DRAFT_1054601 [Mycena floridula]|nr:hypothetical protein C8J56DRAFT_1054601 [Mycena floridula]